MSVITRDFKPSDLNVNIELRNQVLVIMTMLRSLIQPCERLYQVYTTHIIYVIKDKWFKF